MAHENKVNEEAKQAILSEATPIRIGFVISIAAALVSAVWWASSVSSDLRTLVASQAAYVGALQTTSKDLQALKLETALKEASMQKDIDALIIRVNHFETEKQKP